MKLKTKTKFTISKLHEEINKDKREKLKKKFKTKKDIFNQKQNFLKSIVINNKQDNNSIENIHYKFFNNKINDFDEELKSKKLDKNQSKKTYFKFKINPVKRKQKYCFNNTKINNISSIIKDSFINTDYIKQEYSIKNVKVKNLKSYLNKYHSLSKLSKNDNKSEKGKINIKINNIKLNNKFKLMESNKNSSSNRKFTVNKFNTIFKNDKNKILSFISKKLNLIKDNKNNFLSK